MTQPRFILTLPAPSTVYGPALGSHFVHVSRHWHTARVHDTSAVPGGGDRDVPVGGWVVVGTAWRAWQAHPRAACPPRWCGGTPWMQDGVEQARARGAVRAGHLRCGLIPSSRRAGDMERNVNALT
eukprot:CAMPEP_0185210350 /NCGR_PEP_ID=MMETSP1140-20130426/65464_1 /TAXON_ID=298111 /ORGANISM="Pavlova sp., Strain CCMP459" /LENGTH=125 /DNA_ID=CAMNT_0027778153 /DNA_START=30 /DNA_END=408 /DNA_ORIENTATION=-